MTQIDLFETAREISISEDTIAINHKGRWEIYWLGYADCPSLERFSHFATRGEALFCYGLTARK